MGFITRILAFYQTFLSDTIAQKYGNTCLIFTGHVCTIKIRHECNSR